MQTIGYILVLALASPGSDEDRRTPNTCFGGLADGKHIIPEEWVLEENRNDLTTASECVAEGGTLGWLPRLENLTDTERLV